MAKYIIHTMPKRKWYVDEYLIPSMVKQNIDQNDILVYNDIDGQGNLRACINAFNQLPEEGSTWHLQDDVVISRYFKLVTEKTYKSIACGFKSEYDGNTSAGNVRLKDMWFSFLCIHIPNKIARECAEWIDKYIIGNMVYKEWWEKGVNDDFLFRKFLEQNYPDIAVVNISPNIVDHIDYLIGGTVNSDARIKQIRSKLWEDEDVVIQLEKQLKEAGK